MWRLVLIGGVLLAGCGSGGEQSVTDYCVEETERFYVRNELPFTSDPEERDEICEAWMAEHDITTKAEIQLVLRQMQSELDG